MAEYDLIVIGAGPGGYVAAIRAAQLGLKTACVEKETQLGGTCLRIGCIPSKALLESSEQFVAAQKSLGDHGVKLSGKVELDLKAMLSRKDKVVDSLTKGVEGLFKKNSVDWLKGTATITKPGEIKVKAAKDEQTHTAKHIIIATGSSSASLPGIETDGDLIGDSTTALGYASVPKRLVVIGAGYIGLELGSVWSRLGAEVTVLEYLDRILPGMDADIAKEAHKLFKRQGLTFHLGTKVTAAKVSGKGKQKKCVVEREGGDPIDCDRVLVAVGRKPNLEGLGLEDVGVQLDDRGRVDVDDHYRTNVEGIYAIGDVIAGPMLAHKAEEEGVVCVEQIARGSGHVNYDAIPGVVYTHPEIASVGKTEEQLKDAGTEYKVGTFFFRGNGRARALGEIDGKVKMLADATTDRLLGVHIIGARAGDLIAEAAAALEFGASAEDIARTSHAHPTLAECLKEAAMAVNDGAIHA